jgi:hypothetical protein
MPAKAIKRTITSARRSLRRVHRVAQDNLRLLQSVKPEGLPREWREHRDREMLIFETLIDLTPPKWIARATPSQMHERLVTIERIASDPNELPGYRFDY